jgi:DUF4097 and DUF4098 domain-containing protein YvlB
MKRILIVLMAGCCVVYAETTEQINKSFSAQPGGKLLMEVDFGAIQVTTNSGTEVTIDVVRKVSRRTKAEEEKFLAERPVNISQEDGTVKIISHAKSKTFGWFHGSQRTEAKYTITVPAQFDAQLKASGGGLMISDLTGKFRAQTSGGSLKFNRLHGPLDGETSGGSIQVLDCEGGLKVHTSGGGIDLHGGSGSLEGGSSGGSIRVSDFQGATHVETSGGEIRIENVAGRIEGSTSGGSISARLSGTTADDVRLETSGGGVTVHVPPTWAFNLDAETSGGGVSSELPVTVIGKTGRNSLKGSVNGGGKALFLRTSGGSIHVKKL